MTVKTAVSGKNVFNKSKKLVTTSDFGRFKPVYMSQLIPGDKITIDVSQFTRLMPMPSPTFGDIDVITRAFFVPYRLCKHTFNDFISNNLNPNYGGNLRPQNIPYFTFEQLTKVFIEEAYIKHATAESHDIVVYGCMKQGDPNRKVDYFSYTNPGRLAADFLHSLGLNWTFCITQAYGEYNIVDKSLENLANKKISLLPFLAFWKIYFDWIVPSRFLNNYAVERGILNKYLYASQDSQNTVTVTELTNLLYLPVSYLEDDFFTSAFSNPNGYEQVPSHSTVLENPSNSFLPGASSASSHVLLSDSGPAASVYDEDVMYMNFFTIKALGALQSMVNRGKLAGTKIQDYLKVTYGIQPDFSTLEVSTYLGSHRNRIAIGDVMSNSDTSDQGGAFLGQYAGKGLGSNKDSFSFEAKEHGLIIITSEIQTRTSYYQGLPPEFTALDRLDFYQPEFDNLSVDAIPLSSLISDFGDSGIYDVNNVFGFTPTYSKYKFALDTISGDFRIRHNGGTASGNLASWYLSREINESTPLFIDEEFCKAYSNGTSSSYDRIFQSNSNTVDNFYQYFFFKVKLFSSMKSIQDALDEGPGGKQVTSSINGHVNE